MKPSRRTVLEGGAAMLGLLAGPRLARAGKAATGKAATGAGRPEVAAFELDEVDVAELGRRLAAGRETARSLVGKYGARIAQIDGRGPTLRSVIERNPDATAIAGALDGERKAQGPRGPLHGIPIVLKDNIATADRMSTSAGSLALAGVPVARDAFVVGKLRAAGAVILAKTNLSEWANIRSTRSISGWSARGGQTRNPYALDRNTSGSSSGTAAAVAANLAAVGVGTETDGSIVSPASICGLCGIKPTLGLVSRTGIVPIAHSQDTAGPMARTVADAAALLSAMAGPDPDDPATADAGRHAVDFTRVLDRDGLRGARLGVARKGLFGKHPDVDRVIEAALRDLAAAGAVIVDPADLATIGSTDADELEVLLYELHADLDAYLAGLGPTSPVKSLADVIRWNQQHADREMPWFGQELFEIAVRKGPLTDKAYRNALAANLKRARQDGIDATLARHKLDAIVAPTGGPAWPIDPILGDQGAWASSALPAIAGYPHVTVPAGQVHGLPVGLSLFASAWSEPTLIRLAYAYEQATRHRRPPGFRATVAI